MRYPVEFKYRFELLIPLADNEGKLFSQAKITRVAETLLKRFGGCRSLPLPHVGFWEHEGYVYHEGTLLFTVDAPRSDESLDWFLSYKRRLKRQFQQIAIYLAITEVLWL